MKKFILTILFGLVSNLFAQQIEIQIVPDYEQEMKETEFKNNTKDFNNSFSNIGQSGSYLGYLLNNDFNTILKDACKWKGCKRPISTNKQNELVDEFKTYLSQNYYEWSKENGK